MRNTRVMIVVVAGLLWLSPIALAQTLPDGPGKEILENKCSRCHTPDVVRTYRHTADDWQDEVVSMIDMGANVTDAELPVLVQYLATNWGPKTAPTSAAPAGATANGAAPSGEADAAALISKLAQSKHSLADGIRQAEQQNGVAISAKFELEGGTLMLSVYTAKAGRQADAEHNVLMELNGEATAAQWRPHVEVFDDKQHIARAATQLTVLQLTDITLSDLIQKAAALQKGTVYSVTPAVKMGKAAVEFLIAAPDGQTTELTLDAKTGQRF